jgi:hypothetical protein
MQWFRMSAPDEMLAGLSSEERQQFLFDLGVQHGFRTRIQAEDWWSRQDEGSAQRYFAAWQGAQGATRASQKLMGMIPGKRFLVGDALPVPGTQVMIACHGSSPESNYIEIAELAGGSQFIAEDADGTAHIIPMERIRCWELLPSMEGST